MYKTILFDFDGTVFDTGEGIMKSVEYAIRELGYPALDYREYRYFVGPPLGASFIRALGVDEDEALRLIEKYRERYAPVGVLECAPYPGVAELVGELKSAGLKLAVATGKPTGFAVQILEHYGLAELFDHVLGCEMDGTRGVKSQVIAAVLERFGKDGAVMVGDRDNDVLGAAECGVPCIGVSWGYAEPGELMAAGAVAIADDCAELKKLLLG